tara:strand:+ start:2079 stop:2435 length:357 start_codon:yes stop_codon:yes gene_type:complete
MKNEHSNDKPKLCPCCESKVFSIQQHEMRGKLKRGVKSNLEVYSTLRCELENNIQDVDNLYHIIEKYFTFRIDENHPTEDNIPCVCCFYRDIKHFINVENTVNRMIGDASPVPHNKQV